MVEYQITDQDVTFDIIYNIFLFKIHKIVAIDDSISNKINHQQLSQLATIQTHIRR